MRYLFIALLISFNSFCQYRTFNNRQGKEQKQENINNANIVIEIGDSNAGGPTLESALDDKYKISDKVKIFYKPTFSPSADDGSWQFYRTTEPINRRPGYTTTVTAIGADQGLVYGLSQTTLIGKNMRYIKFGVGGSTLTALSGTNNDWVPNVTTDLFHNFIYNFYRFAINKLAAEGYRTFTVKAIIVRLGTNDCSNANWNAANFNTAVPLFVNSLRDAIGQYAPIYWAQVKSDLGSVSGWSNSNVTTARNILTGYASTIPGMTMLNYDALTTHDGVHYTQASFLTIGENEAQIVINLGE